MKYIEYYPPVLKEIREINIIGEAMDTELDSVKKAREKIRDECFVYRAEDRGLERWERILSLKVTDENDVELRRFNILAKLMKNKSYLIDVLNNLIGENGYTLRYYADEIRLEVVLKLERRDYLNAVAELLEDFVPVNVELDVSIAYNTHNVLKKHTHNELAEYTHNELIVKEGL